MKQFIITISALVLLITGTMAQKKFEGEIIYKIEYQNLPPEMAQYASMMPDRMKMLFSGEKSRIEQRSMGGQQVIIHDYKKEESIILVDAMGQKIMTRDKIKSDNTSQPEIKYFDTETKNISGYECKKAEIIDKKNKTVLTAYYTEKINAAKPKDNFEGLKGFPLEYEISQNGITMKLSAISVEEKKVADNLFEAPEGYTEMSPEQLQQMGR
jgi:GLPGLI family protein